MAVAEVDSDRGSKVQRVMFVMSVSIAVLFLAAILSFAVHPGTASALTEWDIEDSLVNPQDVSQIGPTTLQLRDGRVWAIPGAPLSEVGREALVEAVARGVEIDAHGEAYSLLEIDHSRGNDRVMKHLARVKLSRLLEHVEATQFFWYSQWGWSVDQYDTCFGFPEGIFVLDRSREEQ